MGTERFTVGLFQSTDDGIRLVGRTTDPSLVEVVRAALLAERRADVARLERHSSGWPRLQPVSMEPELESED